MVQMRFGEPYPFTDRRGGSDVSPWSRPLTQPEWNPSYSTRDAPSQRIPAFVDEHYGSLDSHIRPSPVSRLEEGWTME
ncbi:hypothetical protein OSTOST_25767, partial [Ostertagia ostertagi]